MTIARLRILTTFLLCLLPQVTMAGDPAAADALFKRAVPELEAGHFETACPLLEESQRLDPKAGTLFTLADCHAQWGKIASALVEYRSYMRQVDEMAHEKRGKHESRYEKAKAKVAEIEPLVPELVLVLPSNVPLGTKVIRDGNEVSKPSLGIGVPVDPGVHEIVVEVPGREAVKTTVTIQKGEKARVELMLPADKAAPIIEGTKEPPAVEKQERVSTRASGGKTGIYVAGGIGVVGLAVGAITGGMAMSKAGFIEEHCPNKKCLDLEGKEAVGDAQTLAMVSTIGFGVGIAGAATATILALLSGGSDEKKRQARGVQATVMGIDTRGAMLGVKGAF